MTNQLGEAQIFTVSNKHRSLGSTYSSYVRLPEGKEFWMEWITATCDDPQAKFRIMDQRRRRYLFDDYVSTQFVGSTFVNRFQLSPPIVCGTQLDVETVAATDVTIMFGGRLVELQARNTARQRNTPAQVLFDDLVKYMPSPATDGWLRVIYLDDSSGGTVYSLCGYIPLYSVESIENIIQKSWTRTYGAGKYQVDPTTVDKKMFSDSQVMSRLFYVNVPKEYDIDKYEEIVKQNEAVQKRRNTPAQLLFDKLWPKQFMPVDGLLLVSFTAKGSLATVNCGVIPLSSEIEVEAYIQQKWLAAFGEGRYLVWPMYQSGLIPDGSLKEYFDIKLPTVADDPRLTPAELLFDALCPKDVDLPVDGSLKVNYDPLDTNILCGYIELDNFSSVENIIRSSFMFSYGAGKYRVWPVDAQRQVVPNAAAQDFIQSVDSTFDDAKLITIERGDKFKSVLSVNADGTVGLKSRVVKKKNLNETPAAWIFNNLVPEGMDLPDGRLGVSFSGVICGYIDLDRPEEVIDIISSLWLEKYGTGEYLISAIGIYGPTIPGSATDTLFLTKSTDSAKAIEKPKAILRRFNFDE
jgi:hypothetical protein